MNPKPHFEQPFGRGDNPAVRSELSSRFPQFGQMKNGTRVSVAMCASRSEQACGGALGHRDAQVVEAALGHHPAPRSPLDQALLEEIRLVHVLDRVLLLVDGRRERREPDRAARELARDRVENRAVVAVEACAIDLQQAQRLPRDVAGDYTLATDLGEVTNAL